MGKFEIGGKIWRSARSSWDSFKILLSLKWKCTLRILPVIQRLWMQYGQSIPKMNKITGLAWLPYVYCRLSSVYNQEKGIKQWCWRACFQLYQRTSWFGIVLLFKIQKFIVWILFHQEVLLKALRPDHPREKTLFSSRQVALSMEKNIVRNWNNNFVYFPNKFLTS